MAKNCPAAAVAIDGLGLNKLDSGNETMRGGLPQSVNEGQVVICQPRLLTKAVKSARLPEQSKAKRRL